MKILKETLNIDFIGKRKISGAISSLMILAGIVGYVALNGLNYGIDFRGGTIVQVQFMESQNIGDIRETMANGNVGSFALQTFGEEEENEFLIAVGKEERTAIDEEKGVAQQISTLLKEQYPGMVVRRVESVGPKVGEELKYAAFQAIFFSIISILIYIWIRFQWRFSVGAIIALLHDVLIVLAAFVFTQKEITLPVVAAILTVAGYSINDTIVIFDRIRENFRKFQKKKPFEIMNESINQTLNRTLLTSGTTLFVLLSIFIFGGEIINDFAFAMLLGVIAGTYSSIYVASPVVFLLLKKYPAKIQ